MSEEAPKPAVDWDNLDGKEPAWPPDKKARTHTCEGCGKIQPAGDVLNVFAAVEKELANQRVLLVLCDECRTPERKPSDKPFDDREVTAAK